MRTRSINNDYELILKQAIKLAEKIGRERISFDMIANKINKSRTILYTHFKSTENLKKEILKRAISENNIILIIEALIFNNIKKEELSNYTMEKISEFFI